MNAAQELFPEKQICLLKVPRLLLLRVEQFSVLCVVAFVLALVFFELRSTMTGRVCGAMGLSVGTGVGNWARCR